MIGQETLHELRRRQLGAAPARRRIPVRNPATGEVFAAAPLSRPADVAKAVAGRASALQAWRRTPAGDRIQPLFRLKALLDAHFTEVAKLITQECGKTLAEAEGELRRGIENVEVADRHPVADDGQQPRGHRLGDRRADDPPAGRRRRRHHAVQLPRHDSALVPALRGRLRQHASSSSRRRRRR